MDVRQLRCGSSVDVLLYFKRFHKKSFTIKKLLPLQAECLNFKEAQ